MEMRRTAVMNDLSVDSPNQVKPEVDGLSLLDLFDLFWQRRRLILGITCACVAIAAFMAWRTPKTYLATATILPTARASIANSLSASLASQLGAFANLGGASGGSSDSFIEVLGSRRLAERVVTKLQLGKHLRGWKTQTQLVDRAQGMLEVTPPTMRNKTIKITVAASSPELAAAMANAYVGELQALFTEFDSGSASSRHRFLAERLTKTRSELMEAENQLANYQARNHLASLPEAVTTSMRSLGDLEAQKTSTEVQIKSIEGSLKALRNQVQSLQVSPQELAEVELKKKSLMAQQAALSNAQNAFVEKMSKLPPQGIELARLQRNVQTLNAVYVALNQQLETLSISGAADSDSFIALDRAYPPEQPSRPRKKIILIIGLLAGLLLSVVTTFGLASIQGIREKIARRRAAAGNS